ncbi:MAG: HipA domain-containing protein [Kofleriaceae bacterium]
MTATLTAGAQVWIYDARVGTLQRDPSGAIRFTPERAWLEGGQHPPLGFGMLAKPGVRVGRTGLPPWFENLLPEQDGALRRMICRSLGLRTNDSAALLVALGDDLPGAVRVVGDGFEDPGGVPAELEGEAEVPSSALKISLAGLQLKLSMSLEGDRLVLPVSGGVGRWIVKIPGAQFPELPEIEAATMSWARAMGLSVPRILVVRTEEVQGVSARIMEHSPTVFAIERFDRLDDGRVHQEDLAQSFELPPTCKYGDCSELRSRGKIRYSGVAKLIGDLCGDTGRDDFLDRLAFVIASGNGDAHLKNWSLQWSHEHRPRLSPCYDMVATVSWPEHDRSLALELVRGVSAFASIDRTALRRFVEAANIEHGEERVITALQRARSSWSQVAQDAPERMRAALTAHWQDVPLLRELGGLVDE